MVVSLSEADSRVLGPYTRGMKTIEVRTATLSDAAAMAHVHVEGWRQTYRGVMSDAVLDAPDFVSRREGFWRAILSGEPRFAQFVSALAVIDGTAVGVALSSPTPDDERIDGVPERTLAALYVLASHHGTGAGARLLDAVAPASDACALWVADPNPRAQAFYVKSGFAFTGQVKVEDGVRELRMVRAAR